MTCRFVYVASSWAHLSYRRQDAAMKLFRGDSGAAKEGEERRGNGGRHCLNARGRKEVRVCAEEKADDKEMPPAKKRNGEESELRRGNEVRHCLNEEGRKECVRKREQMIKKCQWRRRKWKLPPPGETGRKSR